MKMKRLIKTGLLLVAAGIFAACTSEDVAQDKAEDKENETVTPKGIMFTINEPKVGAKARVIDFETGANAKTRTIIKHTPGNGADAYWTSTDYIFVQDHGGTWRKSTAIQLNDGGASATFTLPAATYDDGCQVNYTVTGDNIIGVETTATIPTIQTQTTPNNFSHAAVSGDCGVGVARATSTPNKFNFTLKHKPSYLCFLPRCESVALGQNIRLTTIRVESDNTISAVLFLPSPQEDIGRFITLNTGNGIASYFPLTNTSDSPETNAAYMVIAPGTHNLTIKYTIRDKDYGTTVDITQTVNANFEAGKIYDIRANLTLPPAPPMLKYYMWDAQNHYWYGHEPNGIPDGFYPGNATDLQHRWYNTSLTGPGIRNDAQTELFKKLPNVNEMMWYAFKGDAHWGDDGNVYDSNGHPYWLQGIWLKKKAKIMADEGITKEQMENGYPKDNPTDWRKTLYTHTTPGFQIGSVAMTPVPNKTDYFFLPAQGHYFIGVRAKWPIEVDCWTSSATPDWRYDAYHLLANRQSKTIGVYRYSRNIGYMAIIFE